MGFLNGAGGNGGKYGAMLAAKTCCRKHGAGGEGMAGSTVQCWRRKYPAGCTAVVGKEHLSVMPRASLRRQARKAEGDGAPVSRAPGRLSAGEAKTSPRRQASQKLKRRHGGRRRKAVGRASCNDAASEVPTATVRGSEMRRQVLKRSDIQWT